MTDVGDDPNSDWILSIMQLDDNQDGKDQQALLKAIQKNILCAVKWQVQANSGIINKLIEIDGENYNIGFLDICNQPHKPLCDAALLSHQDMYDIADGSKSPYDKAPEYLPKLFL